MIVTANDTELIIKINDEERDDIFAKNDGEYIDVFIDKDNINTFFPRWKEYVDPDNVVPCLNTADASRFEKLHILYDDTIKEKEGEGLYKITSFSIVPAIDDEDEIVVVGIDDEIEQIMMITISFEK